MNARRLTQPLLMIAVLAAAIAGGWWVTSMTQQHVSLVPGFDGCWKLTGNVAQSECLSSEFLKGAAKAGKGEHGIRRQFAVIGYVHEVESRASDNERLAALCHTSMHELGRREGRRAVTDGIDPQWPDASKKFCTAGFVHGLAEGYLAADPSADIAATFPKLCYDASARSGCAHGIGHALVQGDPDNAQPVKAADDATVRCAKLPDGFGSHCDNGVFMELAMRIDHRLSPAQYVSLCSKRQLTEQQLACMNYLTINLSLNDVPPAKTPVWCARAGGALEGRCVESWGRELGTKKVATCESASRSALVVRCIDGAVALQVGSGHVSPKEGRAACRTLKAPDQQTFCTNAVKRYLKASDNSAATGTELKSSSPMPA